jgi:hypothetical protein
MSKKNYVETNLSVRTYGQEIDPVEISAPAIFAREKGIGPV